MRRVMAGLLGVGIVLGAGVVGADGSKPETQGKRSGVRPAPTATTTTTATATATAVLVPPPPSPGKPKNAIADVDQQVKEVEKNLNELLKELEARQARSKPVATAKALDEATQSLRLVIATLTPLGGRGATSGAPCTESAATTQWLTDAVRNSQGGQDTTKGWLVAAEEAGKWPSSVPLKKYETSDPCLETPQQSLDRQTAVYLLGQLGKAFFAKAPSSKRRVVFQLSSLPPVRARVTILDPRHPGSPREIEWDPSASGSAKREIYLDYAAGLLIAASADPTPFAYGGKADSRGTVFQFELDETKPAESPENRNGGSGPDGGKKGEGKAGGDKKKGGDNGAGDVGSRAEKVSTLALDRLCTLAEENAEKKSALVATGYFRSLGTAPDTPGTPGAPLDKPGSTPGSPAAKKGDVRGAGGASDALQPIELRVTCALLPTLEESVLLVGTQLPTSRAGRSLSGSLETVAIDAAQVIASIVVDRAKQRGLALVEKRLRGAICGAVGGAGGDSSAPIDHLLSASRDDVDAKGGRRMFPATCELVQTARFLDLASSTRALTDSLTQDLVELALRSAEQTLTGDSKLNTATRELFRLVASAIVRAARDHSALDERPAVSLLLQASRIVAAMAKSGESKVGDTTKVRTDAVLLFATLGQCLAQQRCDAYSVREILDHTNERFDKVEGLSIESAQIPALAGRVERAASLFQASTTRKPRDELRLTITFLLEVLADMTRERGKNGIDRLLVDDLRVLSTALLDDQPQQLPTVAVSMIEHMASTKDPTVAAKFPKAAELDKLKKAARLLSAILAYSRSVSVDAKGDGAADKARQEALRDSVSALLAEVAANTEDREDGYFALGATLGVRLPFHRHTYANGTNPANSLQLSLPVGLHFYGPQWKGGSLGGGASVVDLGQLVTLDDKGVVPTVARSLLAPGIGVRYLPPYLDRTIVLGLDARYTPAYPLRTAPPDEARVRYAPQFSLGVSIAVDVPLLGLNLCARGPSRCRRFWWQRARSRAAVETSRACIRLASASTPSAARAACRAT